MNEPQTKINIKVPLKFFIPHKIIGALLAVIALITLLSLIALIRYHAYGRVPIYVSYIGINILMAYGFWKMKKWIVLILGFTLVFLAVAGIIRAFQGVQEVSAALIPFLILGVLFLFSYLSRAYLEGEYRNIKVVGFFIALLILSQILAIF